MSSVLDASAVISILLGEPGASAASEAAPSGTVTAINLAEVRDRLTRRTGDHGRVADAIDGLVARGLRVTACDRDLAEHAADLRAAHYDRRLAPISLADCCAIAAALRLDGALVSSDQEQLRIAKQEGASVVPIANSSGVVPEL